MLGKTMFYLFICYIIALFAFAGLYYECYIRNETNFLINQTILDKKNEEHTDELISLMTDSIKSYETDLKLAQHKYDCFPNIDSLVFIKIIDSVSAFLKQKNLSEYFSVNTEKRYQKTKSSYDTDWQADNITLDFNHLIDSCQFVITEMLLDKRHGSVGIIHSRFSKSKKMPFYNEQYIRISIGLNIGYNSHYYVHNSNRIAKYANRNKPFGNWDFNRNNYSYFLSQFKKQFLNGENALTNEIKFYKEQISAINNRIKNIKPNNQLMNFWDFLYFSTITISTVGYGDILPNSTAIRIIVIAEILTGVILTIFVINAIKKQKIHQ